MYLYLNKNIVIVNGLACDGIYDLNNGIFKRVNKAAGQLLRKLNGMMTFDCFTSVEQEFIKDAISKGIVQEQCKSSFQTVTTLDESIRNDRPLRYAWLELTSKCNQNCLHCFMGDDLNRYTPYSCEQVFSFIDTMNEKGISQLILTGGEPTLHPEFERILDHAASYEINLTLLTNGTTTQIHRLIPKFKKYGVRTKLSMLGWGKSHDLMVGCSGAFERLLKTIDIYIKEQAPLELGMTICALNFQDADLVRTYANSKKLRLEMSPIYPLGKASENQKILLAHPLRQYIKICQNDKSKVIEDIREYPLTERHTRPIRSTDYETVDLSGYLTDSYECGQKIIAILSSGKVSPCLLLRKEEFWIGDTTTETLACILDYKNPRRKGYNDRMKLDKIISCSNCEALYVCKGGGCPAITLATKGTIWSKNPYFSKCYYEQFDYSEV